MVASIAQLIVELKDSFKSSYESLTRDQTTVFQTSPHMMICIKYA